MTASCILEALMIGLLRRVTHAQVPVDGTVIAEVGRGDPARLGLSVVEVA